MDKPKMTLVKKTMKASPMRLVAMLDRTRPVTYSDIDKGVAKTFRKLCDQTSSKKAVVTPCITRVKKSQNNTAPRSTGTRSNPGVVTEFRYLVMKPQSTMSTATHAKSPNKRAGLLRSR